ncbi:twin transmembrane helix small protein [Paracoccus bogoriensis]|uniref:twin transmembrane helix small protein n=1 Tax=Paracoccus bogoriensis TaxID=242065 RepID=UPI001CA59726|nr:twin transmembrane helix small protein [Paracoccus bogoriensis]MBW7056863.1 twin transmembrane helix small protein [Paracoccus bogoriensis]
MADKPLFLVTIISIGVVMAILLTGIGGFARGGEFNRKHGNRMMRWRLYAQAAAIAIMLLFVWWRAR